MEALGLLKKIPLIEGIMSRLGIYVESHDNLMKIIYKSESTESPIRFETLDFNLMCVPDAQGPKDEKGWPKDEKLSNICLDSIVQAYFVAKEKINNRLRPKQRKVFFSVEEANGGFDKFGNICKAEE